jgi:hypothetical protein
MNQCSNQQLSLLSLLLLLHHLGLMAHPLLFKVHTAGTLQQPAISNVNDGLFPASGLNDL